MASNKDIMVKVARTGSKAIEVCLDGDNTVEDALEAAELSLKASEDIRVNGDSAGLEEELEDGDRVTLVKNVRGGK